MPSARTRFLLAAATLLFKVATARYPKLPRFMARGRYYTAFAGPAHGDGLATEIRVVPLLDHRSGAVMWGVDTEFRRGFLSTRPHPEEGSIGTGSQCFLQ
jgi:hypothetical protein